MSPKDRPLDVSEVARMLDVDRTTVWTHLRRGSMPACDGVMGGRPWWWESTIQAWMKRRRRRGRPAVSPRPLDAEGV